MTYDGQYSQWKNWNPDGFGRLPIAMRKYYAAELRRLGSLGERRDLDVLEIGFGNGGFLQFAKERGWKITGSELNPELLLAARNAGYPVASADALVSLQSASFDAIFAFDVLEHVEQSNIAPLLLEVRRLLKRGGAFFARFPNGDSPLGLINQNGDLTHVSVLGTGKIRQLTSQIGGRSFFLGGAADPIWTGKLLSTLHAFVTVPLKRSISFLLNMLLTPRGSVAYLSVNLVWVLVFDVPG